MLTRFFNILNRRIPLLGALSFSAFFLAVLSGVILSISYNVSSPFDSIQNMVLKNPYALFIRSVHYWSAQFFLILSALHIIDHLLKSSESRLSRGVWLRLILTVPFILFVLFSGFSLKGDAESVQARNIFSALLNSVPLIGRFLEMIFLGLRGNYQLIYVHHIFTATVIILLTTAEHSKSILPSSNSFKYSLPIILILSFFLIPSFTCFSESIIKGPWFFIGFQEILHWLSYPIFAVILSFGFLMTLFSIPFVNQKVKQRIKTSLLGLFLIYFALILFGTFFRGESWSYGFQWKNLNKIVNFQSVNSLFSGNPDLLRTEIPTIVGRKEGCMACHSNMKGLSQSHEITLFGCYSCHNGNPSVLDKNSAHKDMILIPSNLDVASKTCGKVNCHPEISDRVQTSLMNSMSGVVAVDKFVFGESKNLNVHYDISKIGYSPADKHLRNLCAGCHTGNKKDKPSAVSELTRGGGCSACHISYSKENNSEIANWDSRLKDKKYPSLHPDINIKVSNDYCFGCHSRSGRISTNYEGRMETLSDESHFNKSANQQNLRLLADGRVFTKMPEDIHHEKGLACIDCHTSYEIMGDGKEHFHKEEAIQVSCEDCHNRNRSKTKSFEKLDFESQKLISLRNSYKNGREYVTTALSGKPLIHVFVENGLPVLQGKLDGKIHTLKSPSEKCGTDIEGHSRLSCNSCHTAWTYSCTSCHTSYQPNQRAWDNLLNKEITGGWIEKTDSYESSFAALGVRKYQNSAGNQDDKIDTYIPGMIMNIENEKGIKNFKRLYAPTFSHTISKSSLTCKNCHFEPYSIGLGKGSFKMNMNKKDGSLSFIPTDSKVSDDGLPNSAWTGYLKNPSANSSTRKNSRPFTADEQKRIITVGACFQCHKESDRKLIQLFKSKTDFRKSLSKKCILPKFN